MKGKGAADVYARSALLEEGRRERLGGTKAAVPSLSPGPSAPALLYLQHIYRVGKNLQTLSLHFSISWSFLPAGSLSFCRWCCFHSVFNQKSIAAKGNTCFVFVLIDS